MFFDYLYTGTAAQDTKITVLGQAETETGITGIYQTIEVQVTPTELNGLMSVAAGHTGMGYPDVTLDWNSVKNKLNAAFDLYSGVTGTPAQFRDSAVAVKDTLQKVFSTETFDWGATANPLASIPIEAVKNIKYDEPLEIKNSSSAVSTKLAGTQGSPAFSLLGGSLSSGKAADLSTEPQKKAIRSLYLQALAADRYDKTATPASGSDATATGAGAFDFRPEDTLHVYTELMLTKTRKFVPDTQSVVGGTPGDLKFAVDGCDVVIGDGNAEDDKMASQPLRHVIAWKLKVKTSPTAPQAGAV
jgi:hypothetical protein